MFFKLLVLAFLLNSLEASNLSLSKSASEPGLWVKSVSIDFDYYNRDLLMVSDKTGLWLLINNKNMPEVLRVFLRLYWAKFDIFGYQGGAKFDIVDDIIFGYQGDNGIKNDIATLQEIHEIEHSAEVIQYCSQCIIFIRKLGDENYNKDDIILLNSMISFVNNNLSFPDVNSNLSFLEINVLYFLIGEIVKKYNMKYLAYPDEQRIEFLLALLN